MRSLTTDLLARLSLLLVASCSSDDGGCFETDAEWHYVWTRDTSYAVDLDGGSPNRGPGNSGKRVAPTSGHPPARHLQKRVAPTRPAPTRPATSEVGGTYKASPVGPPTGSSNASVSDHVRARPSPRGTEPLSASTAGRFVHHVCGLYCFGTQGDPEFDTFVASLIMEMLIMTAEKVSCSESLVLCLA